MAGAPPSRTSPDKNFVWRGTLAEANTIRRSLEDRKQAIESKPLAQMTTQERGDIGRIDKMLRIDF